jgi:hypothetical protein
LRRRPAIGAFALGVVGAAGLAGAVALAVLGCATPQPVARAERPTDYAPDGGWANYRPEPHLYEADPARAATGIDRTLSPAVPLGSALH